MTPPQIEQWRELATKYAIAPLLPNEILAIIWSESSGNQNAKNPADPSWGLMQLTLPIAKAYGETQDLIHLMDPETNIRIGAAFLRYLKVQYFANYGNGYVAAYNEGEGNLLKGIPDQDYVNAFNAHLNELDAQTSDSHEQPQT